MDLLHQFFLFLCVGVLIVGAFGQQIFECLSDAVEDACPDGYRPCPLMTGGVVATFIFLMVRILSLFSLFAFNCLP
jgi:hypothetical protein